MEAQARPVAQVKNPVKEPLWVMLATRVRTATNRRLRRIVEASGYSISDVVEAAVSDWLDNYDKLRRP